MQQSNITVCRFQISPDPGILEKDFSIADFNVALDFRAGVHSDISVNGLDNAAYDNFFAKSDAAVFSFGDIHACTGAEIN